MEDLFRKAVYTGVGIATQALENLRKTMEELEKQGKLSRDEGEKVVDAFAEDARETRMKFESAIRDYTHWLTERLDVPSREEFEALKNRVEELELLLKNRMADK